MDGLDGSSGLIDLTDTASVLQSPPAGKGHTTSNGLKCTPPPYVRFGRQLVPQRNLVKFGNRFTSPLLLLPLEVPKQLSEPARFKIVGLGIFCDVCSGGSRWINFSCSGGPWCWDDVPEMNIILIIDNYVTIFHISLRLHLYLYHYHIAACHFFFGMLTQWPSHPSSIEILKYFFIKKKKKKTHTISIWYS